MARAPSKEIVQERLHLLRSYRWSSYRAYAGYETMPEWLASDVVLCRAAPEGADRQRAYRTYVRRRLAEGGEESTLENLRDGLAIGSEAFRTRVRSFLAAGHREATGKRALRARVPFRRITESISAIRNQPWEELRSLRGDAALPLAMWAARRFSARTMREIGAAVGGKDYAAVSVAIKRFEQRLKTDRTSAELQRKLVERLNVET